MSIHSSFTNSPKNTAVSSSKEPADILFPSFASQQETLDYLLSYPQIAELFSKLPLSMKENLLDYYTGKVSLRITYDSVFRRLFRPDLHPDRLELLLSAILGQNIHILKVVPREGTQLTEHGSFVIMDVLVMLEDHSYANIEMQKVGYKFPLARADCYASDIIMRQYSLLKAKSGNQFDFCQMNKVYCIILMETSPREFHEGNGNYLHKRSSSFNTGIYKENPGLHEDLFVCLDIFRPAVHNITDKSSQRDAWLTFLSTTNPSVISSLLEHFPEFEVLYQELAAFMLNPEELIAMLSEELYIMDRNTERLMVTELQDEVAALEAEKKVLQQKLDIFSLSRQGMSAEQISETLHVAMEMVQEVLNI